MTLKSLMQSDVTDIFLNTSDFAEQVTRYIGGDAGNRQAVTAIVHLDQPTFETARGRGYETKGTISLDDASIVENGDAFLIGGERYEVVAVKPVEFGLKEATVVRYSTEARGVRTAGDI